MIDFIISKVQEEDIIKGTFSSPIQGDYIKVSFEKIQNYYFVSKYTKTQVFHENLLSFLDVLNTFSDNFINFNLFDQYYQYSFKFTKKGKLLFNKSKHNLLIKKSTSQNRDKEYIIMPGSVVPPLVDMGVFTTEGKIVSKMYDKFKQINRFIEIIDDVIMKDNLNSINIIDFGCGKSYLTFILYYYLTFIRKIEANIIGLDLKKDVIENCNLAAKKYGYSGLKFEVGDINGYKSPFKVDMVVTLHACNTATDYALYNAIKWEAKYIFSVPCCQHEVNEQFKSKNFEALNRYGLIKERISALLTDTMRCNILMYKSYKVDVLEFVDFSHTPKNILIRAVLSKKNENLNKYLLEAIELQKQFSFKQTLYELVTNDENMYKKL